MDSLPLPLHRCSRNRGRSLFVPLFGLLVPGLLALTAAANDRVRVQYPEKAGVLVLIGEIDDYLGGELTIRLKTGSETVRAEQILEIETYYTPSHRQGLELLDQGETDKALTTLQAALKEENRRWVKREILAGIVRAQTRRGDLLSAANTFAEILATDPGTRHWSVAPLAWAPLALSVPLKNQARQWLTGDRPGLRLVGASLLLLDPVYGEAAQRELTDLSRSPQRPLAPLARAQMWRVRFQGVALTETELARWRTEIQYLPAALRAGPQYLLARGYLSRDARRDAAAEFLWLPTVYNDLESLSARALWDAAAALRESAAESEAMTLLGELVEQFPWSSEAAEARTMLPAPPKAVPTEE